MVNASAQMSSLKKTNERKGFLLHQLSIFHKFFRKKLPLTMHKVGKKKKTKPFSRTLGRYIHITMAYNSV